MEPIAADEMVIEYVGQNIRQVRGRQLVCVMWVFFLHVCKQFFMFLTYFYVTHMCLINLKYRNNAS